MKIDPCILEKEKEDPVYEPIAIVGIGCRFPGAHGPDEYWDLLQKGEAQARPMPKDPTKRRWNNDHFYDPDPKAPGKITHKTVCVLDHYDRFDAEFFSMNPKEAAEMDPHHRILLETTYEAIEDAGWSMQKLVTPNNNVGVYVGAYDSDWTVNACQNMENINNYTTQCRPMFMTSNRISHWFGLEGPSMTIDTACSSSLTAIHLAARGLQQGECRLAMASGAGMLIHPFFSVGLSRQNVFSKDGVLRAFDKKASGFVRGEGVGTLILKTASQAKADGDRVYAFICGSAVHSGGKSKILTKPNPIAEAEVMKKAMRLARARPDDFRFVEAHGTGTPVGDGIELSAILDAYQANKRDPTKPVLKIGSVKSLIGHLEPASGVASVIKMALCLHYGKFTPNANFEEPNDAIVGQNVDVQVSVEEIQDHGPKTYVGVNSFGIGGTLAHAVLRTGDSYTEWTDSQSNTAGWTLHPNDVREGNELVFPITAGSKVGLKNRLSKWMEILEHASDVVNVIHDDRETEFLQVDASIVAFALGENRTHLPHRVLVRANSSTSFLKNLREEIDGLENKPKNALQRGNGKANALFVFPGQGPQCIWMGAQLYMEFPSFAESVHKVDKEIQNQAGYSLIEKLGLFQAKPGDPNPEIMQNPAYCQTAIMMIQIALVELLERFGVKPAACLGHSAGEVASHHAAGLITLQQAVTISLARAAAVASLHKTGGMLVLFAGASKSEEIIDSASSNVSDWFCEVAVKNSNGSTAVSGNMASLKACQDTAESFGVRAVLMRTSTPYHSSKIEANRGKMESRLAGFHSSPGSERRQLPLYSSILGREFSNEQDKYDFSYWWTNVRSQVQFHEAAKDVWKKTADTTGLSIDYVVEIGNHPVLGATLLEIFDETNSSGNAAPVIVNPMNRKVSESVSVHDAVKKSYELGSPLVWEFLQNMEKPSDVSLATTRLPRYVWNHDQSLWNETQESEMVRYGKSPTSATTSSIQGLGDSFWISLETDKFLGDHVVNDDVVMPAAGYLVTALRNVAVSEGYSSTPDLQSVVLKDIVFQNPLLIPKDEKAGVLLQWPKNGTDVSRFIFTDPSVSTLFCSGSADIMTPTQLDMFTASRSPPSWRDAEDDISKDEIYSSLRKRGLQYGPAFQNIIAVKNKSGYGLARMRGIPAGSRGFDIGVLDSCFQACILLGGLSDTTAYIPAGMEQYIQLFEPPKHAELLVETRVHGKNAGKLLFDIWVWQNDTLCAVCQKLIVSPLGSFEKKDENFGYETVLQPVGITDKEYRQVETAMSSIPSVVNRDEIVERQCHQIMKGATWNSADQDKKDEIRVKFEEVLKSMSTSAVSETTTTELKGEGATEASNEFVDKASKALQQFHPEPLFEYSQDSLDKMWQVIKPLAQQHSVLRLAIMVPHSDALLVQCLAASLSKESQWWSHMEMVFYYVDGDPPSLPNEVQQVFSNRSVVSRCEHVKSLEKHQIAEYDISSFHVLLSANLFRVNNLPDVLRHFSDALEPDGIFVSCEVTQVHLPGMLTVAAHASWWNSQTDRVSWLSVEEWKLASSLFGSWLSAPVLDSTECQLTILVGRLMQPAMLAKSEDRIFVSVAKQGTRTDNIWMTSLMSETRHMGAAVSDVVHEWTEGCKTIPKILLESSQQPQVLVIDSSLYQPTFFESALKELLQHQSSPSQPVWHLIQFFQQRLAESGKVGGRVTVVLKGKNPTVYALVGVCRAINYEFKVDLQVLWIPTDSIEDDASSSQAVAEILVNDKYIKQPELHFINNSWCEPKVVPATVQPPVSSHQFSQLPKEQRHWHLELPSSQLVNRPVTARDAFFGARPVLSHKPAKESVRIKIHSTGLNFKHAMVLQGMLPGYDLTNSAGECAGIVEAVGDEELAAKQGFKVGDRVVSMTRSAGHGTSVDSPIAFTFKAPNDMTMEAAATIPVCFATAFQGLVRMARIEPGETILIQSAAGGVGLAAIQIAQLFEARIIAGVSSEKKQKYLKDHYGITDFVPSRSLDFEKQVMDLTDGKGVDVVLNSLAGEALKAGVRCLAFGGRFVEIGKVDILGSGKLPMNGFERNLSFLSCHIDVLLDHPLKANKLLREMFPYFYDGRLKPLPHKVLPMTETLSATEYMLKGQHIGKIVLRAPVDTEAGPPDHLLEASMDRRLRPGSTYIVTGGLGSVGLELARQMTFAGATSIVLVSRKPPRTEWQKTCIENIRSRGVSCVVHNADMGDLQSVKELIAKYGSTLRGVVSVAGVTSDGPLKEMSLESIKAVMQPKADGAYNLDLATREMKVDLDFFIMTSSLVAVTGNHSQSNYVAANMFLAGLKEARQSDGLPASVVYLGAVQGEFGSGMIQDTSLAANLASRGMLAIDTHQAAFGHLEMMSPANWHRQLAYSRIAPVLNGTFPAVTRRMTHLSCDGVISLKKKAVSKSASSYKDVARKKIMAELSGLLQMDKDSIDPEAPIANYGLDSLGSVQLISFLKSETQILATQFDILANATINSLLERMPVEAADAMDDDEEEAAADKTSNPTEQPRVSTVKESVKLTKGDAKKNAGDRLGTHSRSRLAAEPITNKPRSPTKTQRPSTIHQHSNTSNPKANNHAKSATGIWAMEYFSSDYVVKQEAMERARGPESAGHFTQGFGQEAIACMQDHTNVTSMALSALTRLFHTTGVSPVDIGWLGVGTESNPDRSKSIKSVLMTLFTDSGNYNVEGVDHVSACYGGAAALFDAMAWLESRSWDGRLAVVVTTDAALIDPPDDVFNGHGSFAVLLGPEAPIQILPDRFSCHRNTWDFYQPVSLNRHTPIVQFDASIECYLSSLEECHRGFCQKFGIGTLSELSKFLVMHGPNVSMMRKGFRRIVQAENSTTWNANSFGSVVGPSLTLVKQLGSLYTGSIFGGIFSLLYGEATAVSGKHIPVYAYGSGLGASMFALKVSESWSSNSQAKHDKLWSYLKSRVEITPLESQKLLATVHERDDLESLPYKPKCSAHVEGAWYLKAINEEAMHEYYQPVPFSSASGSSVLLVEPPLGLPVAPVGNVPLTAGKSTATPSSVLQKSVPLLVSSPNPFFYEPVNDPLITHSVTKTDLTDIQLFESAHFVMAVFNRPSHGNSFGKDLLASLLDVVNLVGDRIFIIRGVGDGFCAGLDLSGEHMSQTKGFYEHIQLYQRVLSSIEQLPAPVIAVCHGQCLAGGMGFAAVSDLVISHEICKFGLPEIHRGLLPVLVSASLNKKIPKHVVKELSLTGRYIEADEAHRLGLVSFVVSDLYQEVAKQVETFAEADPKLLAFGKQYLPATDNDTATTLMATLMDKNTRIPSTIQSMEQSCSLSVSPEGVATLTIQTKDAAITPALSDRVARMVSELHSLVNEAKIRVLVLTSDCEHFCTGGNMEELAKWSSPDDMTMIARSYSLYVSFLRLKELQIPIIVGFKGKVIGAGIGVGMIGDIRIASEDTTFDLAFFRHNISPGMATTATLAKTVGPETFLEMISGTVLDSQRALEVGIAQEVVPTGRLNDVMMERAARFVWSDFNAVSRTLDAIRIPVDESYLLKEAANQGACFAHVNRAARGELPPTTNRRVVLSTNNQRHIEQNTDSNSVTSISADRFSLKRVDSKTTLCLTDDSETDCFKASNCVACFGGYAQAGGKSDDLGEIRRLHSLIHKNPRFKDQVLKMAQICDEYMIQSQKKADLDDLSVLQWLRWMWSLLLAVCGSIVAFLLGQSLQTERGSYQFYTILANPTYKESEISAFYTGPTLILVACCNLLALADSLGMDFGKFKSHFSFGCAYSFGHFAAVAFAASNTEEEFIRFVMASMPVALECTQQLYASRPSTWSNSETNTNLVIQNVDANKVLDETARFNANADIDKKIYVSSKMSLLSVVVTGYPGSLENLKKQLSKSEGSAQFSYLWLPTLPHTPYGKPLVERVLKTPVVQKLQLLLSKRSPSLTTPLLEENGCTTDFSMKKLLMNLFVEPVDWTKISSSIVSTTQNSGSEGTMLVYFGPGEEDSALSFKANLIEMPMVVSSVEIPKSRLLVPRSKLLEEMEAPSKNMDSSFSSSLHPEPRYSSSKAFLETGQLSSLVQYPAFNSDVNSSGVPTEFVNPGAFPDYLQWQGAVKNAKAQGLRFPYFVEHETAIQGTTQIDGQQYVDFSAYNYLGLANDPQVIQAVQQAVQQYGTSVSASRFASGERPIHRTLETELANFLKTEDALVFSAGYLAISSAVITMAPGKKDLILYDSLIHRSAMEGIAASPAFATSFPHNDMDFVDQLLTNRRHEFERVVVIVEGCYSMDGDLADLPTLVALRQRHGFLLMVDEAHSFGCCGSTGRGVSEHYGVEAHQVDCWAGTLSKSLASCGGYLAGSRDLIGYFKTQSASFLFSAGITPANTAAALASLRKMQREPQRVLQLQRNSKLFCQLAKEAGLDVMDAQGEAGVIPILIGDTGKAMFVAERLFESGIHALPIAYPAVPRGSERLRFFISCTHTTEQINETVKLVSKFVDMVKKI